MSSPWLPNIYQVQDFVRQTEHTFSFKLAPIDSSLPEAKPGQFNMLYPFGLGEIPISISGQYKDGFHHTVRGVGKVSQALCNLRNGDRVGVRGPYGSSWPMEKLNKQDIIVIAGGLGLAPVRPVIKHLITHKSPNQNIFLLIGARHPKEILFQNEIEQWSNQGINIEATVDVATSSWNGHVGVVTKQISKLKIDARESVALICGPEVMMRFCAKELELLGVSDSDIYLSLERNMKCAIGLCGHCQLGKEFICKDGPVFSYDQVRELIKVRQL